MARSCRVPPVSLLAPLAAPPTLQRCGWPGARDTQGAHGRGSTIGRELLAQLLPGTASAPPLLFKALSTQGKKHTKKNTQKKTEREITREMEVSSSESGTPAGAMHAGTFPGMLPAVFLGLSERLLASLLS